MNKQIKESIVAGMGIGFPVTLLCMTLIGGMNEVIAEFMVWLVASALYGLLTGVIFRQENTLNLPASMALHCISCLLITLGAVSLCGYADSFGALLAGVLPVFLIVYTVVYALCMLSMKADEKRINQALKDR